MTVEIHLGNCLEILPTIPSESVDAVITDPPYPCIKRDYGTWTVEKWWALIVEGVVPEVRRILKPTGSAVFILQPNSKHVGQMRGWLWEFMAWVCREWNMVQDVWWWNTAALPCGGVNKGLMRASIKLCMWCGPPNCYREQDNVLWSIAQQTMAMEHSRRADPRKRIYGLSRQSVDFNRMYDIINTRGGVSPFNLLPMGRAIGRKKHPQHSAGTPLKLVDWWTRYIVPPGGTVLDPFCGAGTMGVVAIRNDCDFIGIECVPEYVDISRKRIGIEWGKPVQRKLEALAC